MNIGKKRKKREIRRLPEPKVIPVEKPERKEKAQPIPVPNWPVRKPVEVPNGR